MSRFSRLMFILPAQFMESISERLLFIQPQEPPSELPVLDSITRKMCAAFRQARRSDYAAAGVHFCLCGAASSCCDHFLPDGTVTNFLCIHYVAHHRAAVPPSELDRISKFEWGEADPEENELMGPARMAANKRAMVERSLGTAALNAWCNWGLDFETMCTMLRSYSSIERNNADELFHLLLDLKTEFSSSAFLAVMKRLDLDVERWGAKALRLPNWDRSSWREPMLELLSAEGLTDGQRISVAASFHYLRTYETIIPEALIKLRESSQAGVSKAAMVAISQLKKKRKFPRMR